MAAHEAWALACRLFADGVPVMRAALSPQELGACASLGPAVKSTAINQQYVLCPYCQLYRGQVFSDGRGGRVCQCPDCGPVSVTTDDLAAIRLNEEWLRTKLRLALDIDSRDGIDAIGKDVWRLGEARRTPVLLTRNLARLWQDSTLLEQVRTKEGAVRVIAPSPRHQPFHLLVPGIEWLPLETRFAFYGGALSFIAPPTQTPAKTPRRPDKPVYGPFYEDFRSADLAEHGRIHFTEGQAAVFQSLWSFNGEPVNAERIMQRAGLGSGKPIDLFKVKARDKGNALAAMPLAAYNALVNVQRRQGLYRMPCAANSFSTAKE